MDIKDAYLHGTVGVVKSITVNADKLIYNLADQANTPIEVTLPTVTQTANGLAPKVINTNTSTIGNTYYLLASSNGSSAPSWYKLPATAFSNDDTKVTLTNTTSDGTYRVLFSSTADDTTRTEGARKSTNLKFNPSTGNLTTTSLNLNGDIVINDGTNKDRYIKWQYNNTDDYGWRIGYLGSKSADNNDLTFDSHRTTTGWASALYFKHTTLNAHFAGIVNAPTFQGNLDGTYVNKLTGYTKATAIAALNVNDSLNSALGKLEYKTDFIYNDLFGTDNDAVINKWHEIVDFIDSVKEGTDITDEFVTRKTALTITGEKTFDKFLRFVPNATGGHAYGISNIDSAGDNNTKRTAGIGFLNEAGVFAGAYIGWGESPWNSANNLYVNDSTFTYKNYKILHANNSHITNGVITINGVSITPLTLHQSLANYLPLSGGTMKKDAYISWNASEYGDSVSDWSTVTGHGLRIISSTNENSNAPTTYCTALHVKGSYGFRLASLGGATSNKFFIQNISNGTWNGLLHSGNTHIKDGVITINGTTITPITAHQDLSNYVTLNTELVIDGKKVFNNQLTIRKDVGDTGASVSDQQHNLLLQVRRYSDTHSVAIGVMPTGSGVIWAKANGIGYNTLYLNPHSRGVSIGCGDLTLPDLNDGHYLHIFGSTLSNNSITATKFIGNLNNTLTFSEGAFSAKTYNNRSAVTVNVPTKTSHLTNDLGFVTESDNRFSYGLNIDAISLTNHTEAGWIRIAETSHYVSSGIINISHGYNFNPTTGVTISFNMGWSGLSSPDIVQLSGNSAIFTKVRIVRAMTSATNDEKKVAYIEVYYNTNNQNSISLRLTNAMNCNLLSTYTVGNVPDNYLESVLDLVDKGISANNVKANSVLINNVENGISWPRGSTKAETPPVGLSVWSAYGTNECGAPSAYEVILNVRSNYLMQLSCTATNENTNSGTLRFRNGTNKKWTTVLASNNTYISNGTITINGSSLGSLKNPYSIKFKNSEETEVSYDGSSAVDLTGGLYYAKTAGLLKTIALIIDKKFTSLTNASWTDTGYTFTDLESGTYAILVTSTNLVASGIMSVYKNIQDSVGDEIPLHVYGTAGWRPYLRTNANKLLISSNDVTAATNGRTVTIKIAKIL